MVHLGGELALPVMEKGLYRANSAIKTLNKYGVDSISQSRVILNRKSKNRLPKKAEWEYAARSGGKAHRWSGTNIENMLI